MEAVMMLIARSASDEAIRQTGKSGIASACARMRFAPFRAAKLAQRAQKGHGRSQ